LFFLNWIFISRRFLREKHVDGCFERLAMSCGEIQSISFSLLHAIFVGETKKRNERQIVDSTDDDGYLILFVGNAAGEG
jgi:hypothetical protein